MKWKLVPEEPTKEQHEAGINVGRGIGGSTPSPTWIYEAMLAAAPVPEGNHKTKVSDLLKGSIAMIEELENENAMLRDEIMRLK